MISYTYLAKALYPPTTPQGGGRILNFKRKEPKIGAKGAVLEIFRNFFFENAKKFKFLSFEKFFGKSP